MKEKLYTIPVNEAFDEKTECPICSMYNSIENWAVDFAIGPSASYMQDDVRMATDAVGFCERHVDRMYERGNRLGLALMLKTHADRKIAEADKVRKGFTIGGGFFKKETGNRITDFTEKLTGECFICEKIDDLFERYIDTVFLLYSGEDEFREKFKSSKGFCTAHYGMLVAKSIEKLDKNAAERFIGSLSEIYIENMKRVRDDLSWFIDKFDYRNLDAPWKESKDAVQRMMMKQNSIYYKNPEN